jgi:signal transduction histidine kinase
MQVARNLLGNALKYTPNGGTVTVRSDAAGGQANAYFDDTGIGISEEDLDHLFEKFYRVRNDATQDIEGNGLGLAIVQAIVEQHRGQVQVQSKVGEGSCFSFYLPLV